MRNESSSSKVENRKFGVGPKTIGEFTRAVLVLRDESSGHGDRFSAAFDDIVVYTSYRFKKETASEKLAFPPCVPLIHISHNSERLDGPVVEELLEQAKVLGSTHLCTRLFLFLFSSRERSYAHLLTNT